MLQRRFVLPTVALALMAGSLSLISACSKDDGDANDPDEIHETADECQSIADACTHDVPGELASECHTIWHDNDQGICAEREAECVDHCMSAGGMGGHGGASH